MAFAAGTAVACSSAERSQVSYDAGLGAPEPDAGSLADSGALAEAGPDAEGDTPEPGTSNAPALRRRRQRREAMDWELEGWPGAQASASPCSEEFVDGTCARNIAGLFAHNYG